MVASIDGLEGLILRSRDASLGLQNSLSLSFLRTCAWANCIWNRSYRDDFYQQLLALDRVEFGGRPGNFPEDTPLPSSQPHQRVCSAAELAILPTRTLDVDDVAAARDSIAVGERAALAAAAAASASSANYAATPTLATAATTAAAATAAFGQNCDQHAANPTAQARDLQQTDELSSLVQYSQEGCAVCLEPWQLNDLVSSIRENL